MTKNAVTKPKRGQPTKYDAGLIPIVQALVKRGFTNLEIAETLNVDEKTLYNWRREHPELQQALQRSKEEFDDLVEASLLMKAQGYERTIEKATASGKVVKVREYFPPSDTAIQFWLRNRKAETYRERQEHITKHEVSDRFLQLLESVERAGRAERESAEGKRVLLEKYKAEDVIDAEVVEIKAPGDEKA